MASKEYTEIWALNENTAVFRYGGGKFYLCVKLSDVYEHSDIKKYLGTKRYIEFPSYISSFGKLKSSPPDTWVRLRQVDWSRLVEGVFVTSNIKTLLQRLCLGRFVEYLPYTIRNMYRKDKELIKLLFKGSIHEEK